MIQHFGQILSAQEEQKKHTHTHTHTKHQIGLQIVPLPFLHDENITKEQGGVQTPAGVPG